MQKFDGKKIDSGTNFSCLPPTLNKLAVSDQYGFFMTVVLHPEIINQSLHRQINKTARNEEN